MKWHHDPDAEDPESLWETEACHTCEMDTVPRVGEEIWPLPHGSYPACVVTNVAYWIGKNDYCVAAVYCKERDK